MIEELDRNDEPACADCGGPATYPGCIYCDPYGYAAEDAVYLVEGPIEEDDDA